MKDEFFKVVTPNAVFSHIERFATVSTEAVDLQSALGRIICKDIVADENLPGFDRAVMDGFAVSAASTFGASAANPAYLTLKGHVSMGEPPQFRIKPGEAAGIATGGMLPLGADSVVMKEHAEMVDDTTLEVHRPVAPGSNMVGHDEDFKKGELVLTCGTRLRSQELGLLAALGILEVPVYKKPVVGIISTGDEVVPVDRRPRPGCIRDVNTYTLAGLVAEYGGIPKTLGLVPDSMPAICEALRNAVKSCDMVLLSGGSSVGARDFTIGAIESLDDARVLVHGIGMRPGKPTILAQAGSVPVWGVPGQVASAMIVFSVIIRPFLEIIAGLSRHALWCRKKVSARLARNVPSVNGRVDYVRVRLFEKDGSLWAGPVFGKSGLLNTMTGSDGIIEVAANIEGLVAGEQVEVSLF